MDPTLTSFSEALQHGFLQGDEAAATGYTMLIARDGNDFRVRRPTANRWDLIRTADGWKIKRRTLRLLDGSPDARALLGRAVKTKAKE